MTIQNPRLPELTLDLQKTTVFVSRPFRLTQADKGYIQPFRLTNSWSAYDVSEINLNFAATKPDGQIIDIKKEPNRFKQENGIWLFYLPEEIAQAVGNVTAYFYVTDSSDTILATTTKFGYEVSARYGDDVKSNSYISEIEDMEKQFQEYLANAKAQVNAQNDLTNEYKQKLSQILSEMSDKVATWLSTKTAAIDQDIKNRQDNLDRLNADYQAKYNELVASWQNKIAEINTDWEQRKAEIISEAKNQRTDISNEWESLKSKFKADRDSAISQANSDFKVKLDTIQADWNNQKSKLEQEISDFKTNLENKVQVVTNKVSDLVTHTYPDLSSKTDAISTKIAQLKEEFSKIDFSTYATKDDLKNYQPDLSKLVIKNKILTGQNELKRVEFSPYKKNDGSFAVNIEYNDFTKQHLKNLLVKDLPKIQESIGNLQTTKADKSELSNYATKTDLTTKADKSELGNYATKDELNSHQPDLSNYATKSDLDNKVDRSDLNNYAYETQKELSNKANSSELDSYATKGDLDNKADKSELSNYAKTGDITTAIQNVRIKQDFLSGSNNFTSKKIYSPEWSDGHLTFDMSDSYATYKTKTLTDRVSAMQEQITQLQLEVKKKIDPDIGFMLQGRVEGNNLVFNIGNIADISSKKWILLVLNSSVWDRPDNRYYQLKSVLRSDSPFSLLDSSVKICSVNNDYLSFEAEHNDEQFRIKKWSYKQYIYLTLVNK